MLREREWATCPLLPVHTLAMLKTGHIVKKKQNVYSCSCDAFLFAWILPVHAQTVHAQTGVCMQPILFPATLIALWPYTWLFQSGHSQSQTASFVLGCRLNNHMEMGFENCMLSYMHSMGAKTHIIKHNFFRACEKSPIQNIEAIIG